MIVKTPGMIATQLIAALNDDNPQAWLGVPQRKRKQAAL